MYIFTPYLSRNISLYKCIFLYADNSMAQETLFYEILRCAFNLSVMHRNFANLLLFSTVQRFIFVIHAVNSEISSIIAV